MINVAQQDQSFGANLNTSANLSLLESPSRFVRNNSGSNNQKIDLKMMGDLYDPTQPLKSGG